ncbi:hypothetical protein, partial [Klebsiella pneumoniae]|uniref:hypothetical protein n=1 Tax=Klebsiella pneumoniae TaxID=573 RepID=UPI004055854B
VNSTVLENAEKRLNDIQTQIESFSGSRESAVARHLDNLLADLLSTLSLLTTSEPAIPDTPSPRDITRSPTHIYIYI